MWRQPFIQLLYGVLTVLPLMLFFATPVMGIEYKSRLSQYSHRIWTLDDGLPHNSIKLIHQSQDGFIWLGTYEGLVRFDGISFSVFDRSNTPAFKNNGIVSLVEGQDGALWIGTNGGGLLRYYRGSFESITTTEGLPSNYIYALGFRNKDELWVGTNGGGIAVLRLAEGGYRIERIFNDKDGLPSLYVSSFIQLPNQQFLIGTFGGGLTLYHDAESRFVPFLQPSSATRLPSPFVYTLCHDKKEGVWIGTEQGVIHSTSDGRITEILSQKEGLLDNSIRMIYVDPDSTVWIGSYSGGLTRYYAGQLDHFLPKDGLTSKSVVSALEDREGNLWFGTNSGLNQFSVGKFQTFTDRDGLADNYVRCVLQTADGAIYFGSETGLTEFRDNQFKVFTKKDGLGNEYVFSLLQARDQSLWIGTNGGISVKRGNSFKTYSTKDGLSHNRVNALLEDSKGRFWIATNSGLNRFNGTSFELLGMAYGLHKAFVCALYEDARGTVWIGSNLGMFRCDDDVIEPVVPNDSLQSNTVFCFYEDLEGVLWVGTSNGLWKCVDGKRIAIYGPESGFPEGNIFQIIDDGLGFFWLTHNKGVYRLSRLDVVNYDHRQGSQLPLVYFNRSDGMKSSQCNGVSQPAGCRSRDGVLWFPTTFGVSYIDPTRIRLNHITPPVIINQLVINFDAIDIEPERRTRLNLTPGKERFEFNYSALSFVSPEKVRFKYRLESFDESWIDAGTRRTAFYTNLPPGEYRFSVIACNNDGIWNESGNFIEFSLEPFFYQTKWFLGFVVFGCVLLGIAINSVRVSNLKRREVQLETLVQERTAQLKLEKEKTLDALRSLELSQAETEVQRRIAEEANQMKSELLAITANELRDPLKSMQEFSDILLEEKAPPPMRPQFLKLIRDSAYRMTSIINDLLNVNAVETGSLRLQLRPIGLKKLLELTLFKFQHQFDERHQTLNLKTVGECVVHGDEDRLREIIQNLITNAIKYSPNSTTISVRLFETDSRIRLEVRDEGQGMSKGDISKLFHKFQRLSAQPREGETSIGLGLSIVKRLVEMQGGQIWAESPGINQGSTFIVEFPLYIPPIS